MYVIWAVNGAMNTGFDENRRSSICYIKMQLISAMKKVAFNSRKNMVDASTT